MFEARKILARFKESKANKKLYLTVFIGITFFISIVTFSLFYRRDNRNVDGIKTENNVIVRVVNLSVADSFLGILNNKGVFWDDEKEDLYVEDLFVADKPYYLNVSEILGGSKGDLSQKRYIHVIEGCCIFIAKQKKLLFWEEEEPKVTKAIDLGQLFGDLLKGDYEISQISLIENFERFHRLLVTVHTQDTDGVSQDEEIEGYQHVNSRVYELKIHSGEKTDVSIVHSYNIADTILDVYINPVLGHIVEIGDLHSYMEWYLKEKHKRIISDVCGGYLRPVDKFAILWVYDKNWDEAVTAQVGADSNSDVTVASPEEAVDCPKNSGFYVLTQGNEIEFKSLKIGEQVRRALVNSDFVHYRLVWFDDTTVRNLSKNNEGGFFKALLAGVFQTSGIDFVIRFYYVKVNLRSRELVLLGIGEITVPELDKLQYLGSLGAKDKTFLWRAGRSVTAVSVPGK